MEESGGLGCPVRGGGGYKSWGFARVIDGSAGTLDGDRVDWDSGKRTRCSVSRKEPR